MKKQLLVLSLLASFAGITHARTHLTIYGWMDTGFIKETGSDPIMGELSGSRIGFSGTEDLGNGYKATFLLEKRFNLNDGTINGVDWEGASNLGLASPFGVVRFGRMNEIETQSFSRIDTFDQEGVSSMILGTQRIVRVSNVLRYDSPDINGFKFSTGYYLSKNILSKRDMTLKSQGADNNGFAISLNYDNGPLLLLANYSRLSDSNDSNVWSLGGKYKFNGFTVALGYEKTDDKGWKLGAPSGKINNTKGHITSKQDNWIFSADYTTGPHKIAGSLSWMKVKDVKNSSSAYWANGHSGDIKKYSAGYFYSLSKHTMLYGQLAYSDFENVAVSQFFRGKSFQEDAVTGVQIGINHRF